MSDKDTVASSPGLKYSQSGAVDFARLVLEQLHFAVPTASLFDKTALENMEILELGAGTGLLSIALSTWVKNYTVTDIREILPLLEKNILLNYAGSTDTTNISITELDWLSLHATPAKQRSRVFQFPAVDLVFVVDCIYHPSPMPALVDTIDYLSTPGRTTVTVVVELRDEEAVRVFLELWLGTPNWEIWRIGRSNGLPRPNTTLATVQLHTITMIFNVNAAAVAALALTMAVHAAPSPVAHVLQDIAGCDNVNDGHDTDFGNHRDDVDRSAAIRVSVNDATSRGDRDDDSRTDSNRASDNSRTESNRASDGSHQTDSNRGSDESRRTDSNRGSDNSRSESNRASDSLVDARILTDSNRSDESRHSDSNRASDSLVNADILIDSNRASDNSRSESNRASDSRVDARVLTSNRANDDSRHTDSNRASDSLVNADILTTHRNTDQSRITDDVVDARNRDARETRDNSRCDDCTPEVWHAGGVLRRGVTALSQITHVLRVEHLTERCSPEESARRCGPDCNGFIGGWNRDKSLFGLLFLGKAIHGIPSELDVLLSQQWENGEPQFHYEC
ncbi:uncharacterized protein ARMOST_06760 [Armillaria ostoyae]|uniref:Uncharacterized protein n=1 Tax=Armillaria ostoyae TaxID=47428 RepID=A0A284R3W7_ARMOS|nr:uncharacterized protein ARMOST_06760 [Armillaria ostoyae]